jgi:two-component system chemotaxis response regulator CheB
VRESLSAEPDIEVVADACDPYEARDRILELRPDVVTLDIDMPKMDGITFLRLLMRHRPTPVVVMSSHTCGATVKALEALEAGAVDFIGKPDGPDSAHESGRMLAAKIRVAAGARLRAASRPSAPAPPAGTDELRPRAQGLRDLIVMGASTGGPEALREVFSALPPGLPGICIVQHIPQRFSGPLARRLDSASAVRVKEAAHGDRVRPGHALLAPGGRHMGVRWCGDHHVVELGDGPPVQYQRPSVDVLFESVHRAGSAAGALAVMLTGMGTDGARSMANLRAAGAVTLAQDEATCVVYGMPAAAVALGAVQQVVPLHRVAERVAARWPAAVR